MIFHLSLLISATITAPLTQSPELHKRDVTTSTPFQTPVLLTASAQVFALENTLQSVWNSTIPKKHKGKSHEIPRFGNCNVLIPSAINSTLQANIVYSPGTPQPEPVEVPGSVFNVYMFSDSQYKWMSCQDCVNLCLNTVLQAAQRGQPSIQCDMWTGESKDGMPGNSHCYAGYAQAKQNGGSNATICGS